ncbi:MAG: hypothetical protein IE909_18425 [Campylobacterales bacterium]|nr:hypothetical protein [Campylobacterales bacterium]
MSTVELMRQSDERVLASFLLLNLIENSDVMVNNNIKWGKILEKFKHNNFKNILLLRKKLKYFLNIISERLNITLNYKKELGRLKNAYWYFIRKLDTEKKEGKNVKEIKIIDEKFHSLNDSYSRILKFFVKGTKSVKWADIIELTAEITELSIDEIYSCREYLLHTIESVLDITISEEEKDKFEASCNWQKRKKSIGFLFLWKMPTKHL